MRTIIIIILFTLSTNIYSQIDCPKMAAIAEVMRSSDTTALVDCNTQEIIYFFKTKSKNARVDLAIATAGFYNVTLQSQEIVRGLLKLGLISVRFVGQDRKGNILISKIYQTKDYYKPNN